MAPGHVDPYAVLGVPKTCKDTDLRRAYLRLAQEHHPDRHRTADIQPQARHEKRMLEVNEAWSLVDTPAKRLAHDRGESAQRRQATRTTPPDERTAPPSAGQRRSDESSEHLRDWRRYASAGSSGTTTGWQLITFVPPGLALGAVCAFALGMLLRTDIFLALGVICASFAVVSLLALALLRMTRGVQAERPSGKRRSY